MNVPKRLASRYICLSVSMAVAVAGASAASSIQGTLIVHPSGPVDPGYTRLTFDANITAMTPGKTWDLQVTTVSPSGVSDPAVFPKQVGAAPAYVSNMTGLYTVPCAAAKANQVCFALVAFRVGDAAVKLATVCLPVKPSQPVRTRLMVHVPANVGPGAVLRFSAEISRQYCEKKFRVVLSPIDAPGTWTSGWHGMRLARPLIAFPETFTIASPGDAVAGHAQPALNELCFVLETSDGFYPPIAKWCLDPFHPKTGPRTALRHVAGPTPTPGTLARGRLSRPNAFRQPGQPVPPMPDLVIEFHESQVITVLGVRNQGKKAAGPSKVLFAKQGNAPTLVPIGAICAGCFVNIDLPDSELLLYAGGGTVTADALHQVAESNEANNAFVWNWTVPEWP